MGAGAQVAGLPSWLELGGSARLRQEAPAGSDFIASSGSYYLLSRLRFDLGLKPRPGLRLFAQLQDSHILHLDAALRPSSSNPIDLRQAYLELSRPDRFNFRAGRQEVRFGSGRMMAPGEFSNVSRTFDMLRANLILPWGTADVVAGSVVLIDPSRFDRHRPGDHVFGLYGASGGTLQHLRVEPYLFVKRVLKVAGELRSAGDAVVYATGLRLVGVQLGSWQFSAEGIQETGHWAADSARGFAYMLTLGYVFKELPGSPRVSGDYNYASGDHDPNDGVRGGLEPFYGANQPYFSMTPLVGWQNLRNVRAGVAVTPVKPLKIAVDYRDLSLATTGDGFYNSQNVRILLNRQATSRHLGQALEAVATYAAPYAMTISAGFGRLFAGQYLRQSGKPSGYVYPYLSCAVRF